MDCVEYDVEIKCFIALMCLLDYVIQTHQCPAIQFQQLIVGYAVAIRMESVTIAQVTQNVTGSVPDLLIGIGQLSQNAL